MFILQQKLKGLKPLLRTWNREIFGNIPQQVLTTAKKLEDIQLQIDHLGFTADLASQEVDCLTSYNDALNVERNFWREKSRRSRFINGDRNIAFFHRTAKILERQSHIGMLKTGYTILSFSTDIERHTVDYLTKIFATPNQVMANSLPDKLIPRLVTDIENTQLTSLPSME